MIEAIVAFLTSNKAVIGVIVSIGEGVVVLINLWRKFRGNNGGEAESMSASPSKFRGFLWVVNPINLFRKPK